MNRQMARVRAAKLLRSGQVASAVGITLADEGFLSKKTGKALTAGGVEYLVRHSRTLRAPDNDPASETLALVQMVVNDSKMSLDKKVSVIQALVK